MLSPLILPDALLPEDCDRLLAAVTPDRMRPAGLVGQVSDDRVRRAEVAWLDDLGDTGWIMDRMTALVARANRDGFGFDIAELSESAQVARYDAADAAHFDWHADIGAGALAARRKLTAVVQLSDPASYEGGRLEVRPDSTVVGADTTRGTAIVFPSFVLHRVTPVTSGVRWSLTLWAHGPAFR